MSASRSSVLLSILLSSACAATRPPRAMPLSLFTGHWGVVELPIGPIVGRFLIDTGTDHTVVDIGIARRAGWSVTDCVSLPGTVFGDMCRVALPGTRFLGRALPPVRGRTADMRKSDLGQFTDVDGYFGGDWLSRFVVVLDYPNARWNLVDPAHFSPPSQAVEIPFTLKENIIFLPVKLDGHDAQLILDTGNAGRPLLFNVQGQDAMVTAEERSMIYRRSLHIAGGGDGDMIEGHATLELGSIKWPSAEVTVVPPGAGRGSVMTRVQGILGVETLRLFRVTIDYADHRLYLEQRLPIPERPRATYGIMTKPHDGKLVISALAEVGPAATTGVRVGDELRAVGGVGVARENLATIKWSLVPTTPGELITLELADQTGATRAVRLTAIAAP